MEDGEAQQSSSEMLEELYREHAGLLRYTARVRYNIPQSDLDELVNDVFASFLERRPVVADIRGYLLGAIRNAALYYWRKRAHESPLLPEHEEAPDDAEAARMERWTLHLSLGATLARLGTKCRETLMRYYIGEEKPAAIAADMDTTRGYVFQLLHACRKRARELYRNLTEPRR